MRDHVELFACGINQISTSQWYIIWPFFLSDFLWNSFFSCFFFSSPFTCFAMCNIAKCAPPHSSRSRGALRPTRHSHSPERHWLGSVSQRGNARAVWHSGFNHASTPDTSAARRCGILWVHYHTAANTYTVHTHVGLKIEIWLLVLLYAIVSVTSILMKSHFNILYNKMQ